MTKYVFIILIGVFLVYGLIESRVILHEPEIEIAWPPNGSSATTSFLYISGRSRPRSTLYLNSRKVNLSASGTFNEPVMLFPGINRFQFSLKDRFGREPSMIYELVFNEQAI